MKHIILQNNTLKRWERPPPAADKTPQVCHATWEVYIKEKPINSNLFAKNATLLHSMVCIDQFKVFQRGRSLRPIGRDALARSILRGVCAREKQKFLFFGPASVYEKKIWS